MLCVRFVRRGCARRASARELDEDSGSEGDVVTTASEEELDDGMRTWLEAPGSTHAWNSFITTDGLTDTSKLAFLPPGSPSTEYQHYIATQEVVGLKPASCSGWSEQG